MGHMSNKSDSGSSHHSHHRRPIKTHREPSVHSLSSSDISSETSSSIHRKTTPKIAAVIIAAIIVIAGLVGITIYLIDADRFEKQAIALEKETGYKNSPILSPSAQDPSTAVDYQTYRDESLSLMERHQAESSQSENHVDRQDPDQSYESTTITYRSGKDPEGPMDPGVVHGSDDEYSYYEDAEVVNEQLVVDGQGTGLSQEFYPHQREDIIAREQMERGGGHMRGLHHGQGGGVFQRVTYQNKHPYGAKLPDAPRVKEDQEWSPSMGTPVEPTGDNIYDMEPFIDQGNAPQGNYPRRMQRPGQRIRRPGTLITDSTGDNLISAQASLQVEDGTEPKVMGTSEDIVHHPIPPGGSRGGVHVPMDESDDLAGVGISTIDRRPGRPPFHHMGPIQNRNMFLRRRQQALLQRRMGLAPQRPAPMVQNPILEAERLLAKFDQVIALAESEMKVLQEIGRNITAEGKEINLWEIMKAVNNTIKDNPESAMGRLMDRFYNKYLMENTNQIEDNAFPVSERLHEKSLSSLLFLSFGIFLLNSVNDIIERKGLNQARSFTQNKNTEILKDMLTKHTELLDFFPKSWGSPEPVSTDDNALPLEPPTINSFLRLLMNLMNAYNSGNDKEVECIWSLYCHQLNQQAALGGMVSSVARINSVGMRVILQQVPSSQAVRLMLKSLMQWKDLNCEAMFPTCNAKINTQESASTESASTVTTIPSTTTPLVLPITVS